MIKEIKNRRSIRKFDKTPIKQETIEKILCAGINAPSSKNRQPWKFIVYTDKAKENLISAFKKGLEREEVTPLLPSSSEFLSGAKNSLEIMKQAPVNIVVVNTLGLDIFSNITPEERLFESANIQSIGAAIQNIILEAEHNKLGSLWICDVFFAYTELKEFVGEGEIVSVIALGKKLEKPFKRPRKDFDMVVEFKN